jgi:hypothetical protein
MRKGTLFGVGALTLSLMAGCGGSSDNDSSIGNVTRVLAGYVYVTTNDGGTYTGATTAFILPANNLKVIDPTPANPQSGDEIPIAKPTSGIVQLAVDGSLTRAIDTMNFDMANGNEIICTARGDANAAVTVSVPVGNPLKNDTVTKTLSVPTITLGTSALNNTVLGIQSPSTPTYTPGAADEVQIRIRTTKALGGTAANGSYMTPAEMMNSNGTDLGTGFVAGQVYDVAAAVLDKNGIVITGATTTLATSDATRVTVSGTQLTAVSGTGVATADVVITDSVAGQTLVSESFHGAYETGTATSVTVTPAGPTDLLWAASGAEATTTLTATVKNQLGVGMSGASVAWTSNKSTTNDWNTGAFDSTTAVFTAASGTTGNAGTLATTVTAPTSTGAIAAGNAAKGNATMTATCGTLTGSAVINIIRPLGAFTAVGPARLDVGATSSTVSGNALNYHITGATDLDGDTVANPTVTWTIANTAGASTVGNVGDTSAQSTSAATIDGTTGVVTAGAVAGQAVITATNGLVTSPVTTEIYGNPTKIVLNPNTVASIIAGASGEYAGAVSSTVPFTFTVIDTYGHTVPFTELTPLTTTSSISSGASGSITAGGLDVHGMTLTLGSADGTFTVGTGGFTWTGTAGGVATPLGGITRTVGINVP